jgi:hypothetical protein
MDLSRGLGDVYKRQTVLKFKKVLIMSLELLMKEAKI